VWGEPTEAIVDKNLFEADDDRKLKNDEQLNEIVSERTICIGMSGNKTNCIVAFALLAQIIDESAHTRPGKRIINGIRNWACWQTRKKSHKDSGTNKRKSTSEMNKPMPTPAKTVDSHLSQERTF
jgi:hypothetical protein